MKLVFCCKEIEASIQDDVVVFDNHSNNFVISTESMEVVLCYCPFCGTEIEVNDI